ncbi:CYGB [Cordylochernes scorpioides]|uniref:CYGB n=1 Tax=Cordylochernes scorpioides TaxID=51811 RepID=A0ABY6K4G1_9ARAC|nr:CYGB [Cordylochernes scorpioides]
MPGHPELMLTLVRNNSIQVADIARADMAGGWSWLAAWTRSEDPVDAIGLNRKQRRAVRDTWNLLKPNKKQNVVDIFIRLFEKYPSYQKYFHDFADVPMAELPGNKKLAVHALNVFYSFTSLIDGLDEPESLNGMLEKIGRNHKPRGLSPQHMTKFYNAGCVQHVGEVILEVVQEKLGPKLSPYTRDALVKTVNYIIDSINKNLLFEKYPSYQKYFHDFADVPMAELPGNKKLAVHALNVFYSFTSLIDGLDEPESLNGMLEKIGRNHKPRGLSPHHMTRMPGHRKRRQFKQTDAFTRGMVIGLKRAGWSIRQIAADTHLGASTVHRLWRRWLEQGNVAINRNVGATRVTSARVDRRILRQAVAAPQATCTAILQHVQDTLDHSISTRTISRRLVANGLHSCRPLRRLPLTPPNRRQRLEWCRARSTWMTEWHRVVFSDESRFCLSSDSRRVRVWRRRGERSNPAAIVERTTVRQRGIMVWGAIAYDSRSPLLRIQGTMTAQRYVDDVLRPVTLPYLQGVPNALYQQDNARPHTARISQQALQDVQMLPWPPYSPDLSPIEHVWDIIGRRLHALPQPRSEDELWQMKFYNAGCVQHVGEVILEVVQEKLGPKLSPYTRDALVKTVNYIIDSINKNL